MFFTLITFLIVLSILVFVHELGHFLAARYFSVKAEEFGFGFPPRAIGFYKDFNGKWKKVRGNKEVRDAADTIWSLNWIPLGGFVKIKGEDGGNNDPDSFSTKKAWQRAIILLAGVTMNILLAAVLFSFGFMIGLPQNLDNDFNPRAQITDKQIQVIQVLPNSPAQKAGVQIGDIIKSINNIEFYNFNDLQRYVREHINEELEYKIIRGDKEIQLKIKPQILSETEKGGIGVAIAEVGLVRYPFYIAFWEGIKSAIFLTWAIILAFYELLKNLIMGNGLNAEVAGPVGIAALTGQMARMGISYLIQFTALLSINLAIINAFPFPALDGGRLLFLVVEKIKGSPVKRELENTIHYIGFALLMLLVVVVTFKDVRHYVNFYNLWQNIKNLF